MFDVVIIIFVFKQKTAYESRISVWSSDVCSSDLLAAVVVGGVLAVVHQLDGGEAAVRVHRLGQRLQVRQVLVVPDAVLDEGRHLGGGMDLRLLGGDHGPAALRLHPAHGGGGGRSEEHTSELQSLMRHSYAVFCL